MTTILRHFRAPLLTFALLAGACSQGLNDRDTAAAINDHPEPTVAEKKAAAVELTRRGKAQERSGDSLRAQEYFATAIDSGGDADEILPELMHAAIAGMRYQAAIRFYEDYSPLMSPRRRAELGVVVGVLYLGEEQPEQARKAFESTLQVSPNNARAHFLLAQLLRTDLSDYAGADTHFRSYLALAPHGEGAEVARAGLLRAPEETRQTPTAPEHVRLVPIENQP